MKIKTLGVAAALFACSTGASAATYGFTCITSGLPCTTVGTTDQTRVDVTQFGSQAQFLFTNVGSINTGISSIFFDSDQLAYGSPTIVNGLVGVSFAVGSNPSNLPVGNTLSPPFVSDFAVSANNPAPQNAVDRNETLIVRLSFASGVTLQTLEAGILSGATRIGLNMTSVGGELVNDRAITTFPPNPDVTQIPVPAALPLMLAGLVGMGLVSRRRRSRK